MCSKFFSLVFVCLFLISAQGLALVVKGSVGHEGVKRFGPFTPEFTGTGSVHLIFDNSASDLDIWIGFETDTGEIEYQAFSLSGNRNFETLQLGIFSDIPYYVYVSSYRGASPFRLSLDCSCGLVTTGAAGESGNIELPEAPIDAASKRFVEQMRRRERRIKK